MIEMIAPIHRGHPDSGEHQLALAVMTQALDDLKRNRANAREWFHSSAFTFWAEALDVDADILREGILRRFSEQESEPTYRVSDVNIQKRQMARQALSEHWEWADAKIGKEIGVSPQFIGSVRRRMRDEVEVTDAESATSQLAMF